MTAHEMALLLEGDAMNLDGGLQGLQSIDNAIGLDEVDLFGDSVMDNALGGLPARSLPSKQLQQRLDELHARGCRQGIAWSRQGTIAVISKDGMSIDLRFIRCSPENGDWELSDPSPHPAISLSPSPPDANTGSLLTLTSAGAPFVHLAWAPTSTYELAAIDALGRISIMTFSISLNRPYLTRRWDTDPAEQLHAVVGCYWLPLAMQPNKQFYVAHGPATWVQSEYRYEHTVSPAFGPWHPNPAKSAFLCVTTNGSLKLLFSQNNNRIEETSLELVESVTASDDVITHASLCSDKNTLLVALATASKQLRVVRVNIQWGLPQDKQVPPGSVTLRPSLKVTHLAVTSWFACDPNEPTLDMPQLVHVEILPSASEGPSSPSMTPPVVLTVRSYVPQDDSPFNAECQTIIDRWEVVGDQPQSLHPAFDQAGSRNGAASTPPTMTRLRKLDSVELPKILLTVQTVQFGRVLCFAFSDGTVQFRDRFTMSEIYNEHNTNSIMSPLQVGFQFLNETPCLQVAFSPTGCSFVQINEDWTLRWSKLQYPMDDPSTALQGNQQNAVVAALSLATSAAGANQISCDDILAIARPFAQKPDFTYAWIRELVNMFKIPVDYSEEAHHDQLVRNSLLQLCLSIINHLGFHGDFQPRSFGGKFAMLALHVRNIVVLITIASNTPVNLKEKLNPLDEPDVVDALAGCCKWGVDLLSWLTDSLFQLMDDPEITSMLADPKRFPELARYLQSKKDVSLHLLLCSSTRGFLSATCRRLLHLGTLSDRAVRYYESRAQIQDPSVSRPHPALYQAYVKMQRAVASSLVKVQEFDRLLSALSRDIQTAYQKSLSGLVAKMKPHPQQQQQQQPGATEHQQLQQQQQQQQRNEQFIKKAQAHCELDMLLAANPPPSFREVLARFFSSSLPTFRGMTDPAALYFANHDLLEIDDDPRSLALRRGQRRYVDVFKRNELVLGPAPPRAAAAAGRGGANNANRAAATARNGGGGGGGTRNGVLPGRSAGGSGGAEEGAAAAAGSSAGAAVGAAGAGATGNGLQWRRCVRCAAVMEDVWNPKPGFTFVLAQQRRCACGGNWGLLPRGL